MSQTVSVTVAVAVQIKSYQRKPEPIAQTRRKEKKSESEEMRLVCRGAAVVLVPSFRLLPRICLPQLHHRYFPRRRRHLRMLWISASRQRVFFFFFFCLEIMTQYILWYHQFRHAAFYGDTTIVLNPFFSGHPPAPRPLLLRMLHFAMQRSGYHISS